MHVCQKMHFMLTLRPPHDTITLPLSATHICKSIRAPTARTLLLLVEESDQEVGDGAGLFNDER